MTRYELLTSLHGAAREFRKMELGKDLDKYESEENYKECRENLTLCGCNPDNVYVTDAPYNNVFYAEPDNGIYIEMSPLCPSMINVLHLDRLQDFRNRQNQSLSERNFELFYARIPKPLRIYDFQKRWESIPEYQLPDVWLDIHTSLDYGFSAWDKYILDVVFRLAPKQTGEDYLTVYRGEGSLSSPIENGYSWTTDINTALWFAAKGEGRRIWTGRVQRKEILFFVNRPDEKEVILRPESVKNLSELDMYPGDNETVLSRLSAALYDFQTYGDLIRQAYEGCQNSDIHGMAHTARVLLNCLLIANETDWVLPEEYEILALAAVFHDVGRENDGRDAGHGRRSAEIMSYSPLLSSMDMETRRVATSLVAAHDMPDEDGCAFIYNADCEMDKDRVIDLYQILKDADALDRYRLGGYRYEFDFRYLRLEESKRLPLITASLSRAHAEQLLKV